jgi:hypothetical protein
MKLVEISIAACVAVGSLAASAQTVATQRWVDVRKVLTGAPAGFPTTYTFTVNCPGSTVIPATFTITANAAGFTLPSRDVGATCTLTETRPAAPAGLVWTTSDTQTFVVQAPPNGAPPQSPQQVIFTNALGPAPVDTSPASVPTLGHAALGLLSLLIVFFGAFGRRFIGKDER